MTYYKGIKESLNQALFLTKCNKAIEMLCSMDQHTLSEAIVKAEKLQSDSSAEIMDLTLEQDAYDALGKMATEYGATREAMLSFLIELFVSANNND